MTDKNDPEKFKSLRGFINKDESIEELYFAYSASLRIFGVIQNLNELTRCLGVAPTHVHRRGDRRTPDSPPYKHDYWSYKAPLDEKEPLHTHIDALWSVFRGQKQYLIELKRDLTVDVFLGYRSNCDQAGITVPHQSLRMFVELEVPFGMSVIIT